MLNEYRTVTSLEEVISIIRKSKQGQNTFLWMSSSTDKRLRFPVGNFKLDKKKMQFTVHIDASAKEYVKKESFYYLKLDYDVSAFKVYVLDYSGQTLTCSIPDKVLSVEKREKGRKKIELSVEKEVSLKLENELIRDSFQEFNYMLIDYSSGGIGLLLLEDQMRIFSKQKGDILLSKVGEHPLNTPVALEPVYYKKVNQEVNGKEKVFYRVGFEFDENATPDLMDFFRKL